MAENNYLYEIYGIDAELKRINERSKQLRSQKKRCMTGLYNYMISQGIDRVIDGKKVITINQCDPNKKRAKIKPKKQKKEDAIYLFREIGIPNPEEFYMEFEQTQKINNNENNGGDSDDFFGPPTKKKGKKNKKDEIDPMLGF